MWSMLDRVVVEEAEDAGGFVELLYLHDGVVNRQWSSIIRPRIGSLRLREESGNLVYLGT